jgi:hypothetical protein
MSKIADAYGFELPSDLGAFWNVAKKHWDALFDVGVTLVGPCTILGGGEPAKDLDRFGGDPPELFTVAEGDTDGLHWGYVLHEPGVDGGWVGSYYARDGYPISYAGPTIGHAMFEHVSSVLGEMEAELEETRNVGEEDAELAEQVARVTKLERALRPLRKKAKKPKREKTPTIDGLGLRGRSSIDAKKLQKDLHDKKKIDPWIARGWELLAEGDGDSALHIARDALAALPTDKQDGAVLLAVAAYEKLHRPLLARTFAPRLAGIKKRIKHPPKIDNDVSDTMELALLNPKNVRTLFLEQWGAQDEPPDLEAIATLVNLESLTLRGYSIGDLPSSFRKLKKLRDVELFMCKLVTIPKVLGSLPIESLNIVQSVSHTPKREVRVPKGMSMPKLESLDLVACGLREVPAFVLRAKKLGKLDLANNLLRELPDAIGDLRALRILHVGDNRLTTLPASMKAMKKLGSLWIENNRIATLPNVLGELRLSDLELSKNPLVKDKAERDRTKKLAKKVYFT